MCGIIGGIGKRAKEDIIRAAGRIRHRGPDASGCYADGNAVLAHQRLAILDLSENGAQPYHYENLVLVFNGEIYNYAAVREELIRRGYHFISRSDTEVLIKAFHCWNIRAVEKLEGMFAFALYDKDERSLYLFRDRIGMKPLYYTLHEGLYFCSELRGILPFLPDSTLNYESVYEYFRTGYISREKAIFKGAHKLLPGNYLYYKEGTEPEIKPYWSIPRRHKEDLRTSDTAWKEELHAQMIRSFSSHMVSDVPVGVFLSGGIDSSLVASILQKHHGNIHTFTIGFSDERFNEAPYAAKTAQYLGTRHTEFTLEVKDALEVFHHFYDIFDEPFADSSGIPTAVVSRMAKQAGVKVVLSADGGDELFAGYDHYFKAAALYDKLFRQYKAANLLLRGLTRTLVRSGMFENIFYKNPYHKITTLDELLRRKEPAHFYHAFLANQSEAELKKLLVPETAEHIIPSGVNGVEGFMLHDLMYYLPDNLLVKSDRATMYSSIEGRLPFLDHRLIEMAQQIPFHLKHRNGISKWILKEILADYIPRSYFERPKRGFSIPIFRWFSTHMDHLFNEYLSPEKIRETGIFQEKEVLREHKKYLYFKQRGEESNIEKMWRMLGFMMWWEKWKHQTV